MHFHAGLHPPSFGFSRAIPFSGHCAPGSSRVYLCTRCKHLAQFRWLRGYTRMTLIADERDCAGQLSRFFPKLPAVRIPVRVTPQRPGQIRLQEATVVEFGTVDFAIFLSKLALEFDDRVRIVREGGGRPAEAAVIALQYHDDRKAVAVRFLDSPCEWMIAR